MTDDDRDLLRPEAMSEMTKALLAPAPAPVDSVETWSRSEVVAELQTIIAETQCSPELAAFVAALTDTGDEVSEAGYVDAFYRIAIELGFNVARSSSPKDVFENEMLPRIRAMRAVQVGGGK